MADTDPAPERGGALEALRAMLRGYGLGDLADALDALLRNPDYTDAQVFEELYKTDAYKRRFPAMAKLREMGLGMDEGAYIEQERAYQQVLAGSGLPQGFYDSHDDYAQWMLKGVSPSEVKKRVDAAQRIVQSSDQGLRDAARNYYGLDSDHLTAYLLDADRAQPLIDKQVRAIETGAAGAKYGFDLSQSQAEAYAVDPMLSQETELSLRQKFGQARQVADIDQRLAAIDRQTYTSEEALAAVLDEDEQAQLRSKQRALRERARFSGAAGVSTGSLSRGLV